MSAESRILIGFWLGVAITAFLWLTMYSNLFWLIGGAMCSGALAWIVHDPDKEKPQ